MKLRVFSLCIVLMAIGGCEEEEKTVDYYQRHREEMLSKLKECRNDPGGLGRSKNCLNANSAEFRGSITDNPSSQPN